MINNLDITKPRYNEQIWSVPWPFVKSRFHCISVSELTTWHAMTSRNASCRVTNCFPHNYATNHWGLLIFSLMKNHEKHTFV